MTTVIDLTNLTDRSDTVTLNLSSFFNDDIIFHLPLDAYLVYELLDSNGDVIDTFTDEDDPITNDMTPIKVYLEPRLFFLVVFRMLSAGSLPGTTDRKRLQLYTEKHHRTGLPFRKVTTGGLTVSTNTILQGVIFTKKRAAPLTV